MTAAVWTISDVSPAAAGTAVGEQIAGLEQYDSFQISAALLGATGGVLDVYLQRAVLPDLSLWEDWLHFTQLTSGSAAKFWAVWCSRYDGASSIVAVGQGTLLSPAPLLAANSFVGGHPGNWLRAVYVAGSSTSAGAQQTIQVRGSRGVR